MAGDKNIISRFFSKTPVRLLMFSALVLFLASFFINLYIEHTDNQQKHQFIQQFSQTITATAATKLGVLIHNNDLESLDSTAYELLNQPHIVAAEIFRDDGTRIALQTNNPIQEQSLKVVKDINFADQKQGFLVLTFDPQKILSIDTSKAPKSYMIWLISGLVWGLMFALFSAKNIPSVFNWFRRQQVSSAKQAPTKSESYVLRDILKRDQEKRKALEHQILLVIRAPWNKLNGKANNQLLRLFNRWLPQNNAFALSLKNNLLQIGIERPLDNEIINRVRILKLCLDRLKLKPIVLVHTLGFGDAIYKTFFQVIEPGIWFEQDISHQLDIKPHRRIELQIENDTQNSQWVELCQIKPFNAQQRNAAERQIRYLLGQ